MAIHRLSAEDNGKTVAVQVRDQVIVELAENPTTGFRWSEDEIGGSRIRLIRSDFVEGVGGIGGGGRVEWVYEAIATGRAELGLKLWRDWEGDSSIVDHFGVTLDIR